MPKKIEFNFRPCARCGTKVIDVRDAYTYATFPVEAESIRQEGLVLTPNKDTRKNPFAHHAVVFVPHLPLCGGQDQEDEDSCDQEDMPEQRDPVDEPSSDAPADPGPHAPEPKGLPPGGLAGEEE